MRSTEPTGAQHGGGYPRVLAMRTGRFLPNMRLWPSAFHLGRFLRSPYARQASRGLAPPASNPKMAGAEMRSLQPTSTAGSRPDRISWCDNSIPY
eukprot:scaffold7951_cov444-Prasinococcus_capsulatus_cf.AAC.2